MTKSEATPFTVHPPVCSPLSSVVGCAVASFYALAYLLSLPYILFSLYKLTVASVAFLSRKASPDATFYFVLPFVLSLALPPAHSPAITKYLMKPCMSYFGYSEIRETSDEELLSLKRSVILTTQPHGVVSFTGFCSAGYCIEEFRYIRTAVASVILQTPILKHLLGIFGLMSASSASLKKHLSKGGLEGSVVLYVGGIAELFKSSVKEERLYLSKRKGA